MTITPNDIYNLIHQGESTSVKIKRCSDSVPRSVWETYSAFANTRGGVILLGVTEHKNRPLESRFEDSTVNSTVNSLDDILGRYEITDIQNILLQKMTENPNITIAELSTVTGLDRNAVNYQLKKLRKIINIERSGSDKKGSGKISPK